jgi:hypothetical protein
MRACKSSQRALNRCQLSASSAANAASSASTSASSACTCLSSASSRRARSLHSCENTVTSRLQQHCAAECAYGTTQLRMRDCLPQSTVDLNTLAAAYHPATRLYQMRACGAAPRTARRALRPRPARAASRAARRSSRCSRRRSAPCRRTRSRRATHARPALAARRSVASRAGFKGCVPVRA